jgi:hypothetical protein
MWLKVVAAIVLFLALPFAAAIDSTPLIVAVFALFLADIVALFLGNSPLRAVDYRDGMFWIKGFSGKFLEGLKEVTDVGAAQA